MKLLRRVTLLQLFSLLSLLGVIVIGVGLGTVIGASIEDAAIANARDKLSDVVRAGAARYFDIPPAEFAALHTAPDDYNVWDQRMVHIFSGLPIYVVKVWNTQSTIVWSDQQEQIGQRHPEDEDLQEALEGEVHAAISPLTKPENAQDRGGESTLLELYVPVLRPGTFETLGVFEVYQEVDDIAEAVDTSKTNAWGAIIIGMGGLYLILVGLVARASRTITRLRHLQELERYFSPAVARAIAAGDTNGVGLGAGRPGRANLSQRLLTRGEITVLFTDIRDFTRQSEQMDAEDVVEMLNAYMDVVTTAVFRHNGSIDKFLGDGVLAVFGAPVADPNHALDAVLAAQEIRERLADLNALRRAAGQAPIPIGTAIATGLAVTGNIGSNKQLSFTVTGDTVNLGSRLVGMAQAGEVLINARTYELMQHDAETGTTTGPWLVRGPVTVPVRGREEPATIYLLDMADAVSWPGEQAHPAAQAGVAWAADLGSDALQASGLSVEA